MRTKLIASIVGLAAACAVADVTPITTELVASGLVRPIGVFAAPGDTSRIFVIEKQGRIRIVENGVLLATPFMDIDPLVGGGTSSFSEQGLLGLAFHPDYDTNGKFYVNYTNNSGATVVAEYQVSANPNVANLASQRILLTIAQPFSNHNGGWIDFSPNDGYLYISLGDGGSANDPGNRGQNLNDRLGKMLRIDVDGNNSSNGQYGIPASNPFVGVAGTQPEIWAYGLRNAWRNAFDRLTGDLYIADVGQNAWEEINFQPANSTGGENYGWRCYEGNNAFNTSGCAPANTMVFPVQVYSHSLGCSVTGGHVYRGCRIPENHGTYFYADYCTNTIWSIQVVNGVATSFANRTTELAPGGGLSITSITSFGEDANGEIYICDQNGGEVFKIVPDGPTIGDWNGDGALDFFDIAGYLGDFAASAPRADINGDNQWNFLDVLAFLNFFAATCPEN